MEFFYIVTRILLPLIGFGIYAFVFGGATYLFHTEILKPGLSGRTWMVWHKSPFFVRFPLGNAFSGTSGAEPLKGDVFCSEAMDERGFILINRR